MGNLLFEAGSLEKAEKYYLKAIQCSAGKEAQAFAGLGNIKMELSQSDTAIEKYREAIKINPRMPAVHHNLANLLLLSDKVEEAIESYTTCLEQDPNCADAWYNLGNAFSSKHDYPNSIKAFKTSL